MTAETTNTTLDLASFEEDIQQYDEAYLTTIETKATEEVQKIIYEVLVKRCGEKLKTAKIGSAEHAEVRDIIEGLSANDHQHLLEDAYVYVQRIAKEEFEEEEAVKAILGTTQQKKRRALHKSH